MKIVLVLFIFTYGRCSGQPLCIQIPGLPMWGYTVGILFTDSLTHDSIGTGFVVGRKDQILTCAHVVGKLKRLYFLPILSDTVYSVYTKYVDSQSDLAIMRAHHQINERPLRIGRFSSVSPGDSIYYIGYNTIVNGCCIHSAEILFVGKTRNCFREHYVEDCLQFYGNGIPGYSGGPVLNGAGEVVGILKEAWLVRAIKAPAGSERIRNSAYSIMPFLSKLTEK